MKNLIFFLVLTSAISSLSAQSCCNYNDVAVIVNDSSQTSINIGNYFQAHRNIPSQNIIHISCTTDEGIDSTTFQQIQD